MKWLTIISRSPSSFSLPFQAALKVNEDRPVMLRVYNTQQNQSRFIAVPR